MTETIVELLQITQQDLIPFQDDGEILLDVVELVETDLQQGVHLRRAIRFSTFASDRLAQFSEHLDRAIEHLEFSLRVLEKPNR